MRIGYSIKTFLFSSIAIAVLVLLLFYNNKADHDVEKLMLYCAAGIKKPVAEAVRKYKEEYGVDVQIQYAGSGTLLSNIKIVKRGDLYLAADDSYIRIAQKDKLVAEAIPLATMHPVIAVKKGNPKNIRNVEDLLRNDVMFALANPDAAAIGNITRDALSSVNLWESTAERAKVFKPTVNDVAIAIVIGSVDAGIIWDVTVNQYPELEIISSPLLSDITRTIEIGVLTSTDNPAAALKFARYLGAPEKGLKAFAQYSFTPVEGDAWAETPEIVLFSGGINRLAIRGTLQKFEEREGVRITSVYNGCGILVSQMKAGKIPDAYFACDKSFMIPVSDLFFDDVVVSHSDMVLLVARGNPKKITNISDLQMKGLKVGLANAEQSALGSLTMRVLEKAGLYKAVMKNVKVQTPTADLLVNQIRTGSLDAVIVYEANTVNVRNQLEILKIDLPGAVAFQPIAVSRKSKYKYLSRRLIDVILSQQSREIFESSGFSWQAD